jgi:hypothetical protein
MEWTTFTISTPRRFLAAATVGHWAAFAGGSNLYERTFLIYAV